MLLDIIKERILHTEVIMDLQLDVRIQRTDNKIVYVVAVYDIDSPVNYHSYDCYYFKQGSDLNEIMTDLKNSELSHFFPFIFMSSSFNFSFFKAS